MDIQTQGWIWKGTR